MGLTVPTASNGADSEETVVPGKSLPTQTLPPAQPPRCHSTLGQQRPHGQHPQHLTLRHSGPQADAGRVKQQRCSDPGSQAAGSRRGPGHRGAGQCWGTVDHEVRLSSPPTGTVVDQQVTSELCDLWKLTVKMSPTAPAAPNGKPTSVKPLGPWGWGASSHTAAASTRHGEQAHGAGSHTVSTRHGEQVHDSLTYTNGVSALHISISAGEMPLG